MIKFRTISQEDLITDRHCFECYLRCNEVSLPAQLHGDVIRLKQVLINLVKNALKFTVGGTINILVSYDFEESHLIFKIMDTGKGFRSEDKPKLF